MISTAYQIIRDFIEYAKTQDDKQLLVDQIDLTIKEVERIRMRDRKEAISEGRKQEGSITADFANRGLFNCTARTARVKECQRETEEKLKNIDSEAMYMKRMLELERRRFEPSGARKS